MLINDCKNLVKTLEFHKKAISISTKRLKRLNWNKTNVNWATKQWGSVIWFDEVKIFLFGNICINYFRRRITRDLHHNGIARNTKYSQIVMKWGCIILEYLGRICMINCNINAAKYINETFQF